MPIRPTLVSRLAVEAAIHGALSHRSNGSVTHTMAWTKAERPLSLTFLHRLATLAQSQIRPGFNLRASCTIEEWRFLVESTEPADGAASDSAGSSSAYHPVSAVTVAERQNQSFEMVELNEGPFVTGTAEAVRRAEALPAVRVGDFEALILFVPALYVVALWLQNRKSEDDLLLAIPPSNSALPSYQPISSADFVDKITSIAAAPQSAATAIR